MQLFCWNTVLTNSGYFSNSLTRECVPCSYCFPDQPGLTFPVNQCAVRGQPALYRCLPVIYQPPPGYQGSVTLPRSQVEDRRSHSDRRRIRRRRRRRRQQRTGNVARRRNTAWYGERTTTVTAMSRHNEPTNCCWQISSIHATLLMMTRSDNRIITFTGVAGISEWLGVRISRSATH